MTALQTPAPEHLGLFWHWSTALIDKHAQPNDGRILDALILTHLTVKGSATNAELQELTGLSQSSISRTCRRLGHIKRQGGPGLCFVSQEQESRHLRYRLSPAGLELAARF